MIEDTADLIGRLQAREREIKVERARLDAEWQSIDATFDALGVKRRGRPPHKVSSLPPTKRNGRTRAKR